MRVYTVYLKRRAQALDLVLVKEGFCWPGFFLSSLWALGRGLWLAALAIYAASMLVSLLAYAAGLGAGARGMAAMGFATMVGFVANDLRRWTLERCGFVMDEIVTGKDIESAERRFLDHNPELAARLAEEA